MKKYIFIMGLMTCMCLMTQSCSNEEDHDIKATMDGVDFNIVGKPGEYSGYWMVNGEKADSCVMTYDGKTMTFSAVPVYRLLKKAGAFSTSNAQAGYWGEGFADGSGEIQLEAGPFVTTPIRTGYTVNYFYFSNDNKSKSLTGVQFEGLASTDSNLNYGFSLKFFDTRTKTEETRLYVLAFSNEVYGVFDFGQRSWAIRYFIQGLKIGIPNKVEYSWPLNPMIELTFISNGN